MKREAVSDIELQRVLEQVRGKQAEAARLLGVSRQAVSARLKKFQTGSSTPSPSPPYWPKRLPKWKSLGQQLLFFACAGKIPIRDLAKAAKVFRITHLLDGTAAIPHLRTAIYFEERLDIPARAWLMPPEAALLSEVEGAPSSTEHLPFAEQILDLRRRLGLSQEALATRLNVSFASVNRWEGGRSKPQRAHLLAVERLLAEVEHEPPPPPHRIPRGLRRSKILNGSS